MAKSIQDGRWQEQKDRLYNLGYTVLFIVEGSLKDASFTFDSLLGAVVNAELTEGTHVFRTWDIRESKFLIEHLQKKMPLHCHAPTDSLVTNKRKKDNTIENIWVRQLACIPLISEGIARAILVHFGSMRDLRDALQSSVFPDVPIRASGGLLGKARIEKLREVFA